MHNRNKNTTTLHEPWWSRLLATRGAEPHRCLEGVVDPPLEAWLQILDQLALSSVMDNTHQSMYRS